MSEKFNRSNLIQQMTHWTENLSWPALYGKKVCVIIPCQNRNQYLTPCLNAWLSQSYDRFEIVVIDYSSSRTVLNRVMAVANKYSATVALNPENNDQNYDFYSKISVFQVKNITDWNMSHALNYGVRRSTSDSISIAGCDTIPQPHYLETALHVAGDKTIASVWCGRITFPRVLWYAINGYQEFCTGWGGEDSDFRFRALNSGYKIVEMDKNLCPSIWHPRDPKTVEPTSSNLDRCIRYANFHGLIGNYSCFPGGDQPIIEKNTGGHYIYVASLKEDIKLQGGITKRCCYAGALDDKTYFYSVPDKADGENCFSDAIVEKAEIRKLYCDKDIWYIIDNIKDICGEKR